ncbi:transposase domain-containing protein [Pseudomonas sp. NFX15]|uniref:transposase domain-containing protein n=1 Tax=Pseudomonas sp. NFX15 TaxID=2816958 RepID=UPI003BA35A26
MDKQITHHKSVNEKLAHEIALLKRFKFAKRSEQLSPNQASLLDDLIDTDIAAIEAELEALQPAPVEAKVRQQPKRAVPIDNNWCENQIRPWALGRSNWLFAGSLRSGKRAAAIMSLIQSARLNGHDPYAYLKDVLTRLPTQRASEITALLPHRWAPV